MRKKRILIRAKERHIIAYKNFLNNAIDSVNTLVKKQQGNSIFFKDKGIDVNIEVNEIVMFLESHFLDIYKSLMLQLGDNSRSFNAEEKEIFNLFIEQNVLNVASILTDQKKKVSRFITEGVLNGTPISIVTKEIAEATSLSRHRAETIAISESANANSKFARKKFEEYNIHMGVWSSAKDKRVRRCHLKRNGSKYILSKGCYSACDGRFIQTGQEVRCRCGFYIYL